MDPPREIAFADGSLTWKEPRDKTGVTHYRIYKNDEYNLVRQVPVGQTTLEDNIEADRVFMSSWNEPFERESSLALLDTPLSPSGTVAIGNVTIDQVVVTEEDIDGNGNIRKKLSITYTPPSPQGDFDRVRVYVEIPDASGVVRGGEEFSYDSVHPAQDVVVVYHDPPTTTQNWRVYVVSGSAEYYNLLRPYGASGESPNWLVSVAPLSEGGSGTEWTSLVTSFAAAVEYAVDQVGAVIYRVTGSFTEPSDATYRGCRIVGSYGGDEFNYSFEPKTGAGSTAFTSRWYPVPETSRSETVYGQSMGPDYRMNSIVGGTTPSASLTIQDQAGLGGLKLNRVDVSTFDTTELEVSAGAFRIKQLSADKIQTGTLKVGGGGSKPGQMGVYDSLGNLIGWIGQSGAYYGLWAKQAWVGGTDPTTAPFYVDGSGNVLMKSTASYAPSFDITSGSVRVQIDTTNKLKVTDTSYSYETTIDGAKILILATNSYQHNTFITPASVRGQRYSPSSTSFVLSDVGTSWEDGQLLLYTNGALTSTLGNGYCDVLTEYQINGTSVINSAKQFVGYGTSHPLYGIEAAGFNPYVGGTQYYGVSGSFTTTDSKTVTVKNGAITNIV